ncbi:pectinesterase inhibitor domain, Pectin lyase fold/virulence factor [Artemisia annua]|uniref:Pectinesterase inhibitor domain, Pectin lyase fold/virulence factor n=1 Tax=Artemisia annua TaxID=35608 RepID=A0A2U1P3U6_ARTAN|nr:pectinesterase inhibitor domain, Pectin lyase fold/virulence factor [Artemisia annua]
MAPKLILSICFMITFMFLCSSETITDIDYWCGKMPHPKTCYHFVASKLDNPTKMLSKGEFLNMTIAATLDEAIFVKKEDEKDRRHDPPRYRKGAIVRFSESLLARELDREPIDPPPNYRAINYAVAATFILMCEDTFHIRNITSIYPLVTADLKKTKRIEDMIPQGIEKEVWDTCVSDCDEAIVRFSESLLARELDRESIDPPPNYRAINYAVAATFILMCEDTFHIRNITSIYPLVIADLYPLMENGEHVFYKM